MEGLSEWMDSSGSELDRVAGNVCTNSVATSLSPIILVLLYRNHEVPHLESKM
jgi:hypothetical protein